MKYRAEIDGLRALAVISVVFYHAGFELFAGGYVGVDVFFVISGYLITSILLGDLEKKQFTLVEFYASRLRRIVPALCVVTIICIPIAWCWMFPNEKREFFQSIFGVGTFTSNFVFWQQNDYFAGTAEAKPLLHTWSLAVEEQFYALFPIFLLATWRIGKQKIFWLIVVLTLSSLALSEWGWRHAPTANFYLLPTRAWELLAGAIAAFRIHSYGTRPGNLLAAFGILAIVLSIFLYNNTTPIPGLYALLPVAGTLLLIMYATHETLVARLLSIKIFVIIGLMSYSIYLWHQPLFAFARLRTISDLETELTSALIAATFALSYLTWKYIETPVRINPAFKSKYFSFSLSAVVFLAFFIVGVSGNLGIDRGDRDTPTFLTKYEKTSDYIANNYFLLGESFYLQRRINGIEFFAVDDIPTDNELLFDLTDNRKKFLIAGNSHSVDFYNVLSSSTVFTESAQVERYGVQIKDIGEKFYSSPDYANADVVIYCSLFDDEDIKHIETIIKRSLLDKKKVSVCENIFTWVERASQTDLDKKIIRGMNDGLSNEEIAKKINDEYTLAFRQLDFINDQQRSNYKNLKLQLAALGNSYEFKTINRMEYVCASSQCAIVSLNLGKYFFDLGHHTKAGAINFGSVIDANGWAVELVGGSLRGSGSSSP